MDGASVCDKILIKNQKKRKAGKKSNCDTNFNLKGGGIGGG